MSEGGELQKCYGCGEAIVGVYFERTVTKHEGSNKVSKVLSRRKYCLKCYNEDMRGVEYE